MNNKASKFIFRITVAHVIAYFSAGIFAILFMGYREHYISVSLSALMLPVDTPIVALGPGLNIIRGIFLALILLPIHDVIIGKKGFLKLALLILGLSFISTIGPAPGSFEGYIYTKLPIQYHLLGIPETLLYIVMFVGILELWYKWEKKYFTIIAIVLNILILLMSVAGYIQAPLSGQS